MIVEQSGRPDGPALVLSNSLGTDMSMWDQQMPVLRDWFRVIRYNRRGAPTIAEDGQEVIDLLSDMGLARASFCGLSLGGMTGMWLAAHAPDRIDRLVLCCTSAFLGPPEAWAERRALVAEKGTEAVAEQVIARWFTPNFGDAERFAALIVATDDDEYATSCSAIEKMDLRDDLGLIRSPTLVIAGAADPATPVEHAQLICDRVAGATLVVIPDAAHLANVEQPAAFNRAVLAHLLGSTPYERGMTVRRAVLGDDYVDRATAAATDITREFQTHITESAWGSVWSRPDLDRRTRSLVTLAVLTTLGREHEIALHVEAAVRNGVTATEISEVLLHTSVYAGAPAANRAFAIAQEVLRN